MSHLSSCFPFPPPKIQVGIIWALGSPGIFIRKKKLHQDESSPDSSLVCVWSWVFYSKVSLPCWLCGFHNTILLLHCFVENPCTQPKKDLEWEGERKEELKLCGQTCRGGVGADQRNCVHSHHGFRSPCLCFTCWCW